MSLLEKLPDSSLGLKGKRPPINPRTQRTSTLHNTTSVNNRPPSEKNYAPSELSRGGVPVKDTYRNRTPEGISF